MSSDDDDLRFGDLTDGAVDTGSPLVDRLIELFMAGFVALIMIYALFEVVRSLFF